MSHHPIQLLLDPKASNIYSSLASCMTCTSLTCPLLCHGWPPKWIPSPTLFSFGADNRVILTNQMTQLLPSMQNLKFVLWSMGITGLHVTIVLGTRACSGCHTHCPSRSRSLEVSRTCMVQIVSLLPSDEEHTAAGECIHVLHLLEQR